MKTFIGIDYHKTFSCRTIMTQAREIVNRGIFRNVPHSVREFIGRHLAPTKQSRDREGAVINYKKGRKRNTHSS